MWLNFGIYMVLLTASFLVPWGAGWVARRREAEHIPNGPRRTIARSRKWKLIPVVSRGIPMASIAALGVVVLAVPTGRSFIYPSAFVLMFACMNGGDLILYLLFRHRINAFLRKVDQEDHRVCLECHYLLRGHGDSGRCPECGAEFTHADLVQAWNDVRYAHYKLA
jgi:uncharacterized paraquat-inducible protein A